MAELDYAYVADYASVEGGRLTAVGASFTRMFASEFPTPIEFSLAGRIRKEVDEDPPNLDVRITAEESGVNVGVSGLITPSPSEFPYNNMVGMLFTLRANTVITTPGLVVVDIHLDGEHVRRLAFDVVTAEVSAG